MHQVARLWPTMKDEDVSDLRVLVGQTVDHPDVDLDLRKSEMKSRQRRQQNVQGKLRVGSDHQRAGRSLPRAPKRLLESAELCKHRTARLEVGQAVAREHQSPHTALEQ